MSVGTWIVMKGRYEKEGKPLIFIGYEYNNKKNLVFLSMKGAGSTKKGVWQPLCAACWETTGNLSVF